MSTIILSPKSPVPAIETKWPWKLQTREHHVSPFTSSQATTCNSLVCCTSLTVALLRSQIKKCLGNFCSSLAPLALQRLLVPLFKILKVSLSAMSHVPLIQKNRSLVFVSHLFVFPTFIHCYCECCLPRTLTTLNPDFCTLLLCFWARPETWASWL